MPEKITKRSVDALMAEDGKEAVLWDSEVKGFGVRVRSGGTKTYVVHYRAGTGRGAPIRKYTIGKHGSPWTPDTARDEAKRILGRVAKGEDPAGEKQAGKQAETMADLCQRFLDEHASEHKKASSLAADQRNIRNHILPLMGKLKVKEVSRADVDRLKRAVAQGKTAKEERSEEGALKLRVQGGKGAANRCLALLSKMFNLAEIWGIRPDGSNPIRHIEKYPERRVERMLSGNDLAHLGAALSAYEGSPYAVAAFRLLIFTGARLDEIQSLRWDDVDFERAELRLASHKSDKTAGIKVIHLSAPALTVLSELIKINGNPYVIAGQKPGSHMVNLKRAWETVRAKATVSIWREHEDQTIAKLVAGLSEQLKHEPSYEECLTAAEAAGIELPAGLVDLRRHDLRHTFASVAASSGMGLPLIGKMLGHTQAQTTQRYAHLAADPVKAGVANVARQLEVAMEGRKTSAEISDISKWRA
jgi:integrase